MQRVRIIGGRFRGRVIRFPRNKSVRPTPDRVRETLFNWLGQDLTELSTLDLFAGSGALTLEALSRGAATAVAIDRDPALVQALAQTAREFGADGLEAHAADARAWLATETRRFDVIFLDPPFASDDWSTLLPACERRLAGGAGCTPRRRARSTRARCWRSGGTRRRATCIIICCVGATMRRPARPQPGDAAAKP